MSYFRSVLAGALIAMCCVMFACIENKIVGAICFSIGLMSIRMFSMPLATGRAMYVNKTNWGKWLLTALCNCIGVLAVCVLVYAFDSEVFEKLKAIGEVKSSISVLALGARAIGCGVLMYIACSSDTPLWITSMCVVAFILAGFEHSIADCAYLICGAPSQIWKVAVILAGNLIGSKIGTLN